MLINRLLLILAVAIACNTTARAQSNFCEDVKTVLNEAPNNFKNITGRMMESNVTGTMWTSTIKVQGVIGYRIVNSMGFFYEGAMVQTKNIEELMPVYEEYKKKLSACLVPLGYKISYQQNFTPSLTEYKKVVFMKDIKEGTPVEELPPHVAMEATYNKDFGKYTIVMFIFNH